MNSYRDTFTRWQRWFSVHMALLAAGVAMTGAAQAQTSVTPTLLHVFDTFGIPSRLTQAADGTFYGVEPTGGDYGYGAIFRVEADGSITHPVQFRRHQHRQQAAPPDARPGRRALWSHQRPRHGAPAQLPGFGPRDVFPSFAPG